jgi:DNA-directed RNA polymerase subunit L
MTFDISVKESSYEPNNGILGSKLSLLYSGNDINHKIVNTLRRITFNDIPTYAFPPELITMTKNTSVFNNDYMRDHLSQLPILNIPPSENNLFYLHPKYWNNIDYSDKERDIYENEIIIDMYINSTNNTQHIMNVTTNDATIIKNDIKISMYDTVYPPLLIQLKPGQSFSCHMRSALSVGEKCDIWAASSNSYYEIDDKTKQILASYETQGQLHEYEFLIKACDYTFYKLEELQSNLNEKVISGEINKNNDTINIYLVDEDHTMGELINDTMQDLSTVIYSGFSRPDNLVRMGVITVKCDNKHSPIDAFNEASSILIKKFKHIKQEFTKLHAKTNTNANTKEKAN